MKLFLFNKHIFNKKHLKRLLVLSCFFIFIFMFFVLYPIRNILNFSLFNGKTLIIFINEAEARPCGGFITAIAEIKLLPPKLKLENVYKLNKRLDVAQYPLNKITTDLYFWDLGMTANLAKCSILLQKNYEEIQKTKINQVVFISIRTMEDLLQIIEPLYLNENKITHKNFFAFLSKKAANIDRHDEDALMKRKNYLNVIANKAIKKILKNPHLIPKITNKIKENIEAGTIFIKNISPEIKPREDDFAIIEWNLGGGKSSRFIQKILYLNFQEKSPNKWDIFLKLELRHLGGENEPLSQDWKGIWELQVPKFLKNIKPSKSLNKFGDNMIFDIILSPGDKIIKSLTYQNVDSLLIPSQISIFKNPLQELYLDFNITVFPQQTIFEANFLHHDNIGIFFSKLNSFRKILSWNIKRDKEGPFITIHEILHYDSLSVYNQSYFSPQDLILEIHFNELLELNNDFSADLIDRDFTINNIHENSILHNFLLTNDKKTLLLGFTQQKRQPEERFFIKLKGVSDQWGNILTEGKRTVIDRR